MSNKVLVVIIIVLCAFIGTWIGLSEVNAQREIPFIANNDFLSHPFSAFKKENENKIDSSKKQDNETGNGENAVEPVVKQEITPVASNTSKSKNNDIHAIYVTGWSIGTQDVRDSLIRNLKDNQFNAIVIDIKDENGQLTYDSKVQTAIDVEASKRMVSNMSSVLDELHMNGIYVIGRIVTFKDHILASSPKTVVAFREEDESVWKDYNDEQWPNPYNKNSWEYPINLAKEAAQLGFDEIQFDYVRFPLAEGNTSTIAYGFESNKKTKADIICDFLIEATKQLKPYNVKVSATIAGSATQKAGDSQNIGQDFQRMAAIVDTICPIIYPSDYANGAYDVAKPDLNPYEIVYHALKDAKTLVSDTSKIRPYLQDFTATWLGEGNYSNNSLEYVTEEVQAAFDNGIYGFSLWDSSNKYHYGALNQAER